MLGLNMRLNHWLWSVPILYAVFFLAAIQFDHYYPHNDEMTSMYDAGWLIDSPWSPAEILESVHVNSRVQGPVYFFLLSLWGIFTHYDLEIARLFSCFVAMLAMAMTYRLARDFIAPLAGLFALVIIASNAFYNWQIWYNRMYTLTILLAAAVLWQYLRIIYRLPTAKVRHYLSVALLAFFCVNTHLFNAIYLLVLGLYHLLVAPKNRRWVDVTFAFLIPALLFIPYFLYRLPYIQESIALQRPNAVWYHEALSAWFLTTTNGAPLLMLPALLAVAVALWKRIPLRPYYFIFPLFLIILTLLARYTTWISDVAMRHHLASWLYLVLFLAATQYILFKFHRATIVLLLLYIIAGISFEQWGNAQHQMYGRVRDYRRPAVQIVSRLASEELNPPVVLFLRTETLYMQRGFRPDFSRESFYFGVHGIDTFYAEEPAEIGTLLSETDSQAPKYWLVYQTSKTTKNEVMSMRSTMFSEGFSEFKTHTVGVDTVILEFLKA